MAICTFIELVRQNQRPGMAVAEVGVWDGETSVGWLPIVAENNGFGILVDNFMGNPTAGSQHAAAPSRRDDIAEILGQRVMGFPRVTILEGNSFDVAKKVPSGSLDICFLDADHRYSFISKDIAAWMPKIRPGGLFCGHDYDAGEYDERFIEMDFVDGKHHGVIKAVRELGLKFEVLTEQVWVIRL